MINTQQALTTKAAPISKLAHQPGHQLEELPLLLPQNPFKMLYNFDQHAFFCAFDDVERGINSSTASAKKKRVRNDVNAALDRHGTLTHQAAVIHDIATVGKKNGIGVALGVGCRRRSRA